MDAIHAQHEPLAEVPLKATGPVLHVGRAQIVVKRTQWVLWRTEELVVNLLWSQTWERISDVNCAGIEEDAEADIPPIKSALHDAIQKIDVRVIDAVATTDDELAFLERIVGEANAWREVFLIGMATAGRRE